VRDLPLQSIHPHAFMAAEAARCARDDGRYWEMHERLFSNQQSLAAGELAAHARAVGLAAPRFTGCLESRKHAGGVRRDLEEALRMGLTSTPTFLLGLVEPGGTHVRATRKIVGAQPYAAFREAIDALLAEDPR
jgi:protein-disulfide isomerase